MVERGDEYCSESSRFDAHAHAHAAGARGRYGRKLRERERGREGLVVSTGGRGGRDRYCCLLQWFWFMFRSVVCSFVRSFVRSVSTCFMAGGRRRQQESGVVVE